MEVTFNPATIYYLLGGVGFLLGGAWHITNTIAKKFKELDASSELRNQALIKSIDNLRQYIDAEFVRKDVYASDTKLHEERFKRVEARLSHLERE